MVGPPGNKVLDNSISRTSKAGHGFTRTHATLDLYDSLMHLTVEVP